MKAIPSLGLAAFSALLAACSTSTSPKPALSSEYAYRATEDSAVLYVNRSGFWVSAIKVDDFAVPSRDRVITNEPRSQVSLAPGKHRVAFLVSGDGLATVLGFEGEFIAGHTYRAVPKRDGLEFELRVYDETAGTTDRVLVYEARVPAAENTGGAYVPAGT